MIETKKRDLRFSASCSENQIVAISVDQRCDKCFVGRDLFEERDELAASDVRKRMDTTRRYVIPLLNYFDSTGLTQRRGEKRILRGATSKTRSEADRVATDTNKE